MENWDDDQDRGGADGQVDVRQNQAFQKNRICTASQCLVSCTALSKAGYLKVIRSNINLEIAIILHQSTAYLTKTDIRTQKQRVHRYMQPLMHQITTSNSHTRARFIRPNLLYLIYSYAD